MNNLKIVNLHSEEAVKKKKFLDFTLYGLCFAYFSLNALFFIYGGDSVILFSKIESVLSFSIGALSTMVGRKSLKIITSLACYSAYVLVIDYIFEPTVFQFFLELVMFCTFVFCIYMKERI